MIDAEVIEANIGGQTPTQLRLFFKAKGRCHYCSRAMVLYPHTSGRFCTAEHITPKAHGGQRNAGNLVAACLRCNTLRGTMDYFWFRHIVEAYGENLPEIRSKRWTDLCGNIARLASLRRTKIRIPARRQAA